jgi:hypothetical protein
LRSLEPFFPAALVAVAPQGFAGWILAHRLPNKRRFAYGVGLSQNAK